MPSNSLTLDRVQTEPTDARLIVPDVAFAASYTEALREGHSDTADMPPPDAEQIKAIVAAPARHIAGLNRQGGMVQLPDGRQVPAVPHAHLWLVAGDVFIGRASIRYELNGYLSRSGGHIGYGIRPALRRRGFGHRILALALAHARQQGLKRVLLTCDTRNIGSARIIEAAGGVLENVAPHPDHPETLVRRYWITLVGSVAEAAISQRPASGPASGSAGGR